MIRYNSFRRSQIFSRGFRTLNVLGARPKRGNRGSKLDDKLDVDEKFYDAIEHLSNTLINDTSRSVAAALTKDHQRSREKIKAQILYKKMLRGPPESSILSHRAREQISHLSLTDPTEWDADAISENFPISHRGATSLLLKQTKSSFRIFRSLDQVIDFDTEMIKRWLTIVETICMAQAVELAKSTESQMVHVLSTQLPNDLRWIGRENVLSRLAFVNGNPNLPFPPHTSLEAFNLAKSAHKPGPFQQIAETYYKPTDTNMKSLRIREQQESIIAKLIPLFTCMDFSVLTKALLEDSSLTFKSLCRDWLTTNPSELQLERPLLPKINHMDLSIGSGGDDSTQPATSCFGNQQTIIPRIGLPTSSQYLGVLPPIVTFSHQEVGSTIRGQEDKQSSRPKVQGLMNAGANQNQPPTKNGARVQERRYICPIHSCYRSTPETAFKRRYLLQDHLNYHFRVKPFTCDRCSEKFISKQNLGRHKLLHAGVMYTCAECQRTYIRSTDRAKCVQKHRQQRAAAEQATNPNSVAAKKLPKIPIFPVNGPHVCPICPDKRGYKLDSSLRKHMRLHHPNYEGKRAVVHISRDEHRQQQSQLAKQTTKATSNPPQRPSSVEASVVNYSRKDSEIAVATDSSTVSQLPITINGPPETYILSSGEIFYTVDSQYTQVDPYYPILATPNVDEALDQRQSIWMEVEADSGSSMLEGEWRTPAHKTLVAYTDGPTVHTHCLPVDLCTSALCLTVTDPSAPSSTSQQSAMVSVDPTTYHAIPNVDSADALDLTEFLHEVIDLSSQGDPVDLSGVHPQPPRPELWDSEPQFSYTHFLNGDDA
ncbi:hypothetical protein Aperf_G00000091122 [Anoplocephala perfoliata]